MMKRHSHPLKTAALIPALILALLNPACGIEVGNPDEEKKGAVVIDAFLIDDLSASLTGSLGKGLSTGQRSELTTALLYGYQDQFTDFGSRGMASEGEEPPKEVTATGNGEAEYCSYEPHQTTTEQVNAGSGGKNSTSSSSGNTAASGEAVSGSATAESGGEVAPNPGEDAATMDPESQDENSLPPPPLCYGGVLSDEGVVSAPSEDTAINVDPYAKAYSEQDYVDYWANDGSYSSCGDGGDFSAPCQVESDEKTMICDEYQDSETNGVTLCYDLEEPAKWPPSVLSFQYHYIDQKSFTWDETASKSLEIFNEAAASSDVQAAEEDVDQQLRFALAKFFNRFDEDEDKKLDRTARDEAIEAIIRSIERD